MSAACIENAKRYLCVKKLTIHDGFTSKTVKLPRAEARFFMGELRNRQSIPVVLLDEEGCCWELLCTCTGGQYALSRIGAFCEAHGAAPGSYFIFYADADHVVRLAVRGALPEDVLAAIAAARAALAARNAPQQSSPPRDAPALAGPCPAPPPAPAPAPIPPPVPPPAAPAAAPSQPPQPAQDDPIALDEMPPVHPVVPAVPMAPAVPVAPLVPVPANPVGTGLVSPAAAQSREPLGAIQPASPPAPQQQAQPRAMPLQDRSNLPQAVPVAAGFATKGATKPHKAAAKADDGSRAGAHSRLSAVVSAADVDKENAPAALPSDEAGGSSSSELQAQPNGAAGRSRPLPSPPPPSQPQRGPSTQHPAPFPPSVRPGSPSQRSPPSPSPPPSRPGAAGAVSPPSPPPASRLRQRFEARLRAQAGRPHPLSVRTDAASPPPLPLGGHPHSRVGPHPQRGCHAGWLPIPTLASLLPCLAQPPPHGPGRTTSPAHIAGGNRAGSPAQDSRTRRPTPPRGGAPQDRHPHTGQRQTHQHQGHKRRTEECVQGDEGHQGQGRGHVRPTARPSLPCEELMDWEVGRRGGLPLPSPAVVAISMQAAQACPAHAAAASPTASAKPATEAEVALAMLPGWVIRRSSSSSGMAEPAPAAAAATVNHSAVHLALLRHLLLQQQQLQQPQQQLQPGQRHGQGGASQEWSRGVFGDGGAAGSLRQILGLGVMGLGLSLPRTQAGAAAAVAVAGPLPSHSRPVVSPPPSSPPGGAGVGLVRSSPSPLPQQPQLPAAAGSARGRSWLSWHRGFGCSGSEADTIEAASTDVGKGEQGELSECGGGLASGGDGAVLAAPQRSRQDEALEAHGQAQGVRRAPQEAHEESPSSKRRRGGAADDGPSPGGAAAAADDAPREHPHRNCPCPGGPASATAPGCTAQPGDSVLAEAGVGMGNGTELQLPSEDGALRSPPLPVAAATTLPAVAGAAPGGGTVQREQQLGEGGMGISDDPMDVDAGPLQALATAAAAATADCEVSARGTAGAAAAGHG